MKETICRWCKFWKEPKYMLGGDCDEGYIRYIQGECTVNPKWVETEMDHSCGQWQEATEELEEPKISGVM